MSRRTSRSAASPLARASLVALLASALGACAGGPGDVIRVGSSPYVHGSGNVASVDRSLEAFHAISAMQGIKVTVASGPSGKAVVTADDNLLSQLTTVVRDGTLVVAIDGSLETGSPLKVTVTTPGPLDAAAAGSGAVLDLGALMSTSMTLQASAGSTIRGQGSLDRLDLSADSGSTVDLRNATARWAGVHVTSGSTAYLRASESVTGSCVLGSSLHVSGEAGMLDVATDSSSSVRRD